MYIYIAIVRVALILVLILRGMYIDIIRNSNYKITLVSVSVLKSAISVKLDSYVNAYFL